MNEAISQISMDAPMEVSVIYSKDSLSEIDLDLLNAAIDIYGNARGICLVSLVPVALLGDYKLPTSRWKATERLH